MTQKIDAGPTLKNPGTPRLLMVQKWFAACAFVLFALHIASWREMLPGFPLYHPMPSLFLSGAVLLQALAPLAGRRSVALALTLLGVSGVFLLASAVGMAR